MQEKRMKQLNSVSRLTLESLWSITASFNNHSHTNDDENDRQLHGSSVAFIAHTIGRFSPKYKKIGIFIAFVKKE